MKPKESYRWVICFAATLLLFCVIGLGVTVLSFYLPYIRTANGFTNAQTSMLMTLQSIGTISTNLIIDRFYKKVSLRAGITFSVSLLALALLVCAFSGSYPFYCLGTFLCGISTGLTGMAAATFLINTWFQDNRAFALGIASAGTGLASVVAPQIIAPLIEARSLTAAFCAESAFMFLSALILFCLIRKGPYGMGGSRTSAPSASGSRNVLFIFSGHRVILFMAGIFLCGLLVHGTSTGLSLILQENFSGTQRAHLVSIFGFALMAGKVICGRLSDQIGIYRTNYIFFAFMAVGLALLCVTGMFGFGIGIAAVVFLGLGSPFVTVSAPIYVSDFAQKENFPRTLKYCNLTMTSARMVFTSVSGASADLFGSYVPIFALMCILAPVTTFLIQNTYLKCGLTQKRR